jgi:hypothetical protein
MRVLIGRGATCLIALILVQMLAGESLRWQENQRARLQR